MKTKKVYSYQITTQHIDFQKEVTLSSLFHLIMKTAGLDADNNGFGLLELQENNITWVLSRFVLDMERFPQEDEKITIETWIEDVNRIFTSRNFTIRNGNSEVIGHAASSWAMIDIDTRQSVQLDNVPRLTDFIVDETSPIGGTTRIREVEGEVANNFKVKYSHIDVNRHASSPYYLQWLADCFPLEFYESNRLERFEINFLREITFGDEGEVFREQRNENDYYFQINTKEKGTACRARMLFIERKKGFNF